MLCWFTYANLHAVDKAAHAAACAAGHDDNEWFLILNDEWLWCENDDGGDDKKNTMVTMMNNMISIVTNMSINNMILIVISDAKRDWLNFEYMTPINPKINTALRMLSRLPPSGFRQTRAITFDEGLPIQP